MVDADFEQMSNAQKACAEVLIAMMRTSFEGMQRLAELNMAAARDAISSTLATTNELASPDDMAGMVRVFQKLGDPVGSIAYWRKFYELVSATQKESSSLMQAHYTQLTKIAAAAAERNDSSGIDSSNVFIDTVKNMQEQTNKTFSLMSAVAGQMANVANANLHAAASAAKAGGPVPNGPSMK